LYSYTDHYTMLNPVSTYFASGCLAYRERMGTNRSSMPQHVKQNNTCYNLRALNKKKWQHCRSVVQEEKAARPT